MRHNFLHTIKRNTRLLLTAVALICATQVMWGVNYPNPTIYISNSESKGNKIHCWLSSNTATCWTWNSTDEEMSNIGSINNRNYFSKNVSSCNFDRFCIVQGGNDKSGTVNITTDGRNLYDWPMKKWGYYYPTEPSQKIIKSIIEDGKIAFYVGTTWGKWDLFLRTKSETGDGVIQLPGNASCTIGGVTVHYSPVIISSERYYVSDASNWNGIQFTESAAAGKAYIGTNNNGLCSGGTSNHVCSVSGSTYSSAAFSNGNTSISVTEGSTSVTFSSTCSQTTSAIGSGLKYFYYLRSGSEGSYTYTKIANSSTISQTSATTTTYNPSSLSVGTYKIFPLLVDQNNTAMAVRPSSGSELTLIIASACTPPTITAVTGGSRCGAGTVNISATASSGVIKWYTAATEGTYKGQSNSGATFTTESISSSTKYYAEAYDECASQSRTEVSITINTPPSPSINGEDKICVNLSSAGRYESSITDASSYTWSTETVSGSDFSVSSGGGTSDNYVTYTTGATTGQVTVNLTVTDSNGCTGSTSKSVTTVNRPTISSATTGAFVCGDVAATISATSSAGKIKWYDDSTSGNKKGESDSGADYTTDAITTNTSYYAEAADGGCPSAARTEVAIVHYASGPTIEPSSGITQYEPVTVTGNSSSTWSVTTNPASAGYLSTESGTTTTFKAPSGSYTVTDTNTGCGVNITVAEDTEDC